MEIADNGTAQTRDRDAAAAVQQVVQALEEDIVLGVLNPRERLMEDELMRRFSVKRHVVRKALAELDAQGLVQIKRNSGAQVRALTAKEVTDIYALREILETSCAKLIPLPLRPGQLKQLTALQREHATAIAKNDLRAVFRANIAFHANLYALCGNDALIEAMSEYARRTFPARLNNLLTAQPREHARDEHQEILDALRAGDRKLLVNLFSSHLKPARDNYLAALRRLDRLGGHSFTA
jgi:DNA-binding GntR family transcriptional regulator